MELETRWRWAELAIRNGGVGEEIGGVVEGDGQNWWKRQGVGIAH